MDFQLDSWDVTKIVRELVVSNLRMRIKSFDVINGQKGYCFWILATWSLCVKHRTLLWIVFLKCPNLGFLLFIDLFVFL